MSTQHQIPTETKQQILERVKEGIVVSQLAREHGISDKTIYRWTANQISSTVSPLVYGRLKKQRDELLKIIGKLTLELSKEKKG